MVEKPVEDNRGVHAKQFLAALHASVLDAQKKAADCQTSRLWYLLLLKAHDVAREVIDLVCFKGGISSDALAILIEEGLMSLRSVVDFQFNSTLRVIVHDSYQKAMSSFAVWNAENEVWRIKLDAVEKEISKKLLLGVSTIGEEEILTALYQKKPVMPQPTHLAMASDLVAGITMAHHRSIFTNAQFSSFADGEITKANNGDELFGFDDGVEK